MRIVPGQLPVRLQRKFHLGGYEGGHAQVLFRSGRSGYHRGEYFKYESVTDLLFKNVAALAVTESYYPLEVSLANEEDLQAFSRFLSCEIGSRHLYVLRGEASIGYVLAGAMYWVDDAKGSTEGPSVLIAEFGMSSEIEVMQA
jgi:hypothetical protein